MIGFLGIETSLGANVQDMIEAVPDHPNIWSEGNLSHILMLKLQEQGFSVTLLLIPLIAMN